MFECSPWESIIKQKSKIDNNYYVKNTLLITCFLRAAKQNVHTGLLSPEGVKLYWACLKQGCSTGPMKKYRKL